MSLLLFSREHINTYVKNIPIHISKDLLPKIHKFLPPSINWETSIQQYDEMIKYTVALKPETILRRSTQNGCINGSWLATPPVF